MGLFLQDFHKWFVLWIVRLKSLTILESFSQKPLVSVFVPLRSFFLHKFHKQLMFQISALQSFSSYEVPVFLHFKVFRSEVQWFLHFKVFVSKVHTTSHRWSSPYDAPTTFYDFCTTLVHCPERVTHRKSPLQLPFLVTAPNFV